MYADPSWSPPGFRQRKPDGHHSRRVRELVTAAPLAPAPVGRWAYGQGDGCQRDRSGLVRWAMSTASWTKELAEPPVPGSESDPVARSGQSRVPGVCSSPVPPALQFAPCRGPWLGFAPAQLGQPARSSWQLNPPSDPGNLGGGQIERYRRAILYALTVTRLQMPPQKGELKSCEGLMRRFDRLLRGC